PCSAGVLACEFRHRLGALMGTKLRQLATLTNSPPNVYTAIMADAEAKCPKRRFIDFLTQKNLRLTSQRHAIIESVFSTQQHFTAEQLLEWSRSRDKSVSRATVYRT